MVLLLQGLAEIARLFSTMNTANLHSDQGKELLNYLDRAEEVILGDTLAA